MAKKITIIKVRPRQSLWLPGIVDVHLGRYDSLATGRPGEVYKAIEVVAVGRCAAKNHRNLVPPEVDGDVTIVHYYEAD